MIIHVIKNGDRITERTYQVIVNAPATILIMKDLVTGETQKTISRVHDEPFDIEKGVLMCLAKMNGMTHSELKRIIAAAKIQNDGNKEPPKALMTPAFDWNAQQLFSISNLPVSAVHVEEKPLTFVSPKGKRKGAPAPFYVGDKVLIRDCDSYKAAKFTKMSIWLNKVFEVTRVDDSFVGGSKHYWLKKENGTTLGWYFTGNELELVSRYTEQEKENYSEEN